jgi:hypothetical protein
MENGQLSRWDRFRKSRIVNGLAAVIVILWLAMVISEMRPHHEAAFRAVCINNLAFIQDAKQKWALETKPPTNATPTWDDLKPYSGGTTNFPPKCPSGGVYTIGNLQTAPTCTVKGHALD